MPAPRRDFRPHERATRMCEAALQAIEAHPEYQDKHDSAMVIVIGDDENSGNGMLNMSADEAIEALAANLAVLLEVTGRAEGITIFKQEKRGWG